MPQLHEKLIWKPAVIRDFSLQRFEFVIKSVIKMKTEYEYKMVNHSENGYG